MLQTYDRPFIERWLNEVHRNCPQTNQVLSHSILTPNSLVKDLISQWCKEHGIELPKPAGDTEQEALTDELTNCLNSLLHNLTLSAFHQKEAAKELRQLSKQMPTFRTLFRKPNLIQKLLSPLSSGTAQIDPQLHEDLITTVHNLSIHDDNKRVFAEDENVISLLIESLRSGTIQTRSNAAAAIFSLSAPEHNKRIIGKSGAIKYLVDMLEEGHPSAMKDAASAIFSLCIAHENKGKTVREGAVQVILHKIKDHVLVDELLSILALLSGHPNAVEALCNHGAVPFLLGIIRENATSERSKENCVAILYSICLGDRTKRKEISEDEIVNGTLIKLAECGTSRTKRKANGILEKLNMTVLKHS